MEDEIMTTLMMMITCPENPTDHPLTSCPSWKLYDNPFYSSPTSTNHDQQHQQRHLHRIHFPVSARKIAASFWDLTYFEPLMESGLGTARAQIIELKAELEYERKARKKLECLNKRLAENAVEERRRREAVERVCEKLAGEITSQKDEIGRLKKEMAEERKMLRVAEVLREERVQMKLGDAKIMYEEKLLELEGSKRVTMATEVLDMKTERGNENEACEDVCFPGKLKENGSGIVLGKKMCRRRVMPEPENPHISRGIKGFVEFTRVVKAIGSKSRQWGTKLECQKAQLRILLKQKNSIESSNS